MGEEEEQGRGDKAQEAEAEEAGDEKNDSKEREEREENVEKCGEQPQKAPETVTVLVERCCV